MKVTITHLVIKAIAEALDRHPESNSTIRLGWVYLFETVEVFIQVTRDGGEDLGGC